MSKRAGLDVRSMRNEDFLSYKISVLSRILDRGVDKRFLAGLNLPLTSLRILGHLHAHGEGRILAIARSMHLLGSQVSQSMMELVAAGHAAKKPDPSDKRGTLFRLTPKGRRFYESVLTRAQDKQEAVAALIGPANYGVVSACLDTLIAHYGAPGATALESA
ncbi:MAG TPA: MarR family winged helix-turn-helix transcriptional regulator [Candidatus Lustribacter sp.]|nr:MarR family winged helix-turn-helix transcriptional regulator [Candidatus Lustribacter sp.]